MNTDDKIGVNESTTGAPMSHDIRIGCTQRNGLDWKHRFVNIGDLISSNSNARNNFSLKLFFRPRHAYKCVNCVEMMMSIFTAVRRSLISNYTVAVDVACLCYSEIFRSPPAPPPPTHGGTSRQSHTSNVIRVHETSHLLLSAGADTAGSVGGRVD